MHGMRLREVGSGFLLLLIVNIWLHSGALVNGGGVNDTGDVGGGAHNAQANGAALVATDAVTAMPPVRPPPPRVKLNKCCHFNEHMDSNRTCVMGNTEQWVPLIFLISRKQYYVPQGGKPKFMSFQENMRPMTDAVEPTTTTITTDNNKDVDHALQKRYCTWDELELLSAAGGSWLIFSNGSLFLSERKQFIEPQRYCVDRNAALVCFPKNANDEQQRIKIRKCCGWNGLYDATRKQCIFPGNNAVTLDLPLNASLYETIYGFPTCHQKNVPYAIAGDWHAAQMLSENGQLQLAHKILTTNDYCLEHLHVDGAHKAVAIKIFTCLHHFSTETPANAITAIGSTSSDRFQVAALNIGIVISVVFLAATLIAGYMLPSVHHMLHWRCQIYYVFCLFIGDLILAYTQLSRSTLEHGSNTCLLLASTMHFFFLSAFFWLNTMCFNIWWTFRDFRPSSLERNQELLRLRLYSAYAWGVPLLISVIAFTVDHLPETQLLRPGFGVRSCWFSGEHLSIFAYFFGPLGLLLCANIILFISTTHQLTCGLWKRDDVKSSTEKTALGKVCLKLVVVMGVTWIADVISWLVGGPNSAWFFTDMINALQGVFIFIVVGCQPQVWAACKRFCCPRSRQEITNTTNGVQHSSSSQGLPSVGGGGGYTGGEHTQNTTLNTTVSNGQLQAQTKVPMETVC